MGNIDINKLDGNWKVWAGEVDGTEDKAAKNNQIDTIFEKQELVKKAKANGVSEDEITKFFQGQNVDQKEIDEIFGMEKANKKTQKAIPEEVVQGVATVFQNNPQQYVVPSVVEGRDNSYINWTALAQDVKKNFANRAMDQRYYDEACQTVNDVAKVFNGRVYNSKDDIEKISDIAKDTIKTKEGERVLKEFVAIAENHQVQKESAQVKAKYNELRKTMGREEAVEKLKEDFKGSYFKDVIKQFEKTEVMEEARKDVYAAVKHQDKQGGAEKSRLVEKAAKDEIKAEGKKDKYTKKAFRGELSANEKLDFERSDVKNARKAVAAKNRVERIKSEHMQKEKIQDAVKNNVAVQQLENSNLIKVNADGTYDVSALSDLIRETISRSDYRADYQDEDLILYSEIQNVVTNIAEKTTSKENPNGVKITYDDAKHLIDLLGFDRDKKDLGHIAKGVLTGAIKGATFGVLPAAVGALSAKAKNGAVSYTTNINEVNNKILGEEFPITVNVLKDFNFKLNLKVNGADVDISDSQFINFLNQCKAQGLDENLCDLVKLEDGTIQLIVSQSKSTSVETIHKLSEILGENFDISDDLEVNVNQEKASVNKTNIFFNAIMTQAALGALMGALEEPQGELPAIQPHVTAKTYEAYCNGIDSIEKLSPKLKNAAKQLAGAFIKTDDKGEYVKDANGNFVWDKEGFEAKLHEIGGEKSFVNRAELNNYLRLGDDKPIEAKFKEQPFEPLNVPKADPVKPADGVVKAAGDVNTGVVPDVVEDIDRPWQEDALEVKFTSWEGLARGYYPDFEKQGYTLKEVTAMLKKVAAYDENGNYNEEQHKNFIGNRKTGVAEIPNKIRLPQVLDMAEVFDNASGKLQRTGTASVNIKMRQAGKGKITSSANGTVGLNGRYGNEHGRTDTETRGTGTSLSSAQNAHAKSVDDFNKKVKK